MFKKYGQLFIMLALIVIMSVINDYFFSAENFITITKQTAVVGVLAIGELMVIITGGIDLAIGSTLAFSSVLAAMLMRSGTPVLLGIFAAIAIGLVVGFCNGHLMTTFKLPPFIATLGMSGILRGSVLVITGGTPVSSLPSEITDFFGKGTFLGLPVSFIILLVLMVFFQLLLSKTVFGRNVFALGGNSEATRLADINVGSRVRVIYMLSGMLAGLAGMLLIGRVNTASPTAATGYESSAIAASVIGGASMLGGVGTVWGAVVGAFIMSTLSNGFTHLRLNDFFQQAATGFILILAVYIDSVQRRGGFKVFKKK